MRMLLPAQPSSVSTAVQCRRKVAHDTDSAHNGEQQVAGMLNDCTAEQAILDYIR